MARTIFVSRHRMTECPACRAHVRVAADVKRTACTFCGAPVTAPARDVFSRLRDLGASTTGGVVAATLMGLGLVQCTEAPVQDTLRRDSGDHTPSPMYGIPPIDSGIRDAQIVVDGGAASPDARVADASEPIPAPEYGAPPPADAAVSSPDALVADAEDPPPEPDYGLPPMRNDASVSDAEDPPPVALYGISPVDRDAGTKVEDAGDDPVAPLYGGAAVPRANAGGEILS